MSLSAPLRLPSWLAPRVEFGVRDQARYGLLAGALLIAIAYGAVLLLPLAFIYPQLSGRFLLLGLSLPAIGTAMLFLARAGHLRLSTWLALALFWLLSAYGLATSGGSTSSAVVLHVQLVLLAGLLLGLRVGIGVALVDILGFAAYGWLLARGVEFPSRPELPGIQVANGIEIFCLTILLLVVASRLMSQLEESLDTATHERRAAEERLREREELYRKAFDLAPCGLSIRDERGAYLEANQGALQLLGVPFEQALGRTVAELGGELGPGDLERIVEQTLAGQDIDNEPIRYRRPSDGQDFQLLYSSRFITLGGQQRLLTVTTDLSDIHLAEERLRKEQTYSEALIESLPGKLCVLDGDANLMRWNDEFRRATGRTDDELLGETGFVLLPEDQHEAAGAAFREVLAQGRAQLVAQIVDAAGRPRPHLFILRRVPASLPILICWGLDLEEHKGL
jgi:PAS domain S-box-containing protein